MNFKNQIDFNELKSTRLPITLFAGLFVWFFIWFFQPFELNKFNIENKALFLAGYGLITSFELFLGYFIPPFLWKSFFTYKFWNSGFHLIYLALNLVLLAFFNRIYGELTGFYQFNTFSIAHYIFYTLAIGLLPIISTIFIADRVLLKNKFERLEKKSKTNKKVLHQKQNQLIRKISIKSDKTKDKFDIELSNILYFQSDDNYVNIFYLHEGNLSKRLMRITLSQIEKQLDGFDQIVRCHRSFVVNLDKVTNVEGKSQHYSFVIPQLPNSIPVSKTFPKSIIDSLSSS